MRNIFVVIFEWFEKRKALLYILGLLLVFSTSYSALNIEFEENISSFFSDDESENENILLKNFKLKDRIVVMISGIDPDSMVSKAILFEKKIQPLLDDSIIKSISARVDDSMILKNTDFVYNYLPIFLNKDIYQYIDMHLTKDDVDANIRRCFSMLTSPSGMILGDVLLRDPLNIGTGFLKNFEKFGSDFECEQYDGYIFSKDMTSLLMFLEPVNGMGSTGKNEYLVERLDEICSSLSGDGVIVNCIGGAIVAVYNARQIKHDTFLTLIYALVILIPVLFFSFRYKRIIPLILLPPILGGIFALGIVALVKGSISSIAIGAGAVVLGIALSYSIHVISHSNHCDDAKQIIEELSYPLTIGCMTTIGAFVALMFTHSMLLRDMGIFASLTLVGTTLYTLIFLPHFLPSSEKQKGKSSLLNFLEKINSHSFENNRWVVAIVSIIFIVCLFFYKDVQFDDDMSHINYMPKDIEQAEDKLNSLMSDSLDRVYIISCGKNLMEVKKAYSALTASLYAMKDSGLIENIVEINDFIITEREQKQRIDEWNTFWNNRKNKVLDDIEESANSHGFNRRAFDRFSHLLNREYSVCDYSTEVMESIPLLSDWINVNDNSVSIVSRISLSKENKDAVYSQIETFDGTYILDRVYFSSQMVVNTSNDFNYILLISSLIVFVALLVSYGRLELALLTFLPMCISWVIILGFMAIFDIKFNIVNIILATFIFGIGDDFSIFMMDGLIQEYKNGKKLISAHKMAIFFSAFTTVIGMGVLIFAHHPALKSIAVISVLGLSIVVLVSYTIQPFIFKLLVTEPTSRGGYPYTLVSLLNTFYWIIYFFLGCVLLNVCMVVLMVLPLKSSSKKNIFHLLIYNTVRIFLKSMFMSKITIENKYKEDFRKPSIIISNHQSFLDIMLLLSLNPKMIMITKDWVWNSPYFGRIIRFAGFHNASEGSEKLAEKLKPMIEDGYSVVIFPEGTRSVDFSIQRFHKGAFYLSKLLKLDILPVVLYGTGHISSKKQRMNAKYVHMVVRIMSRIVYKENSAESYQEQSKNVRKWYVEQYKLMNDKYSRTDNCYFRQALFVNYIYKGPVLEWYIKIKTRIDGYYNLWDRLVPRAGFITDVGCGYGQLSIMLGLLSPDREVLGIDYDEEKIEIVNNSFQCKNNANINFIHGNMHTIAFPDSDTFIFNDSLHYVNSSIQEEVLNKCVLKLRRNGLIIIRDGDSSSCNHSSIEKTELWSTKILRFNKTEEALHFIPKSWMIEFAQKNNLKLRIEQCDKKTSETIYVLTKNI